MTVLCVFMFMYCIHSRYPQRPGETLDPLKLDLETVVSFQVVTGNGACVLYESNKPSLTTEPPLQHQCPQFYCGFILLDLSVYRSIQK